MSSTLQGETSESKSCVEESLYAQHCASLARIIIPWRRQQRDYSSCLFIIIIIQYDQ